VSTQINPQPPDVKHDQHLPYPALLLVNGHSRTGRQMFGEAISALREAGIEIKEAHLSRDQTETGQLLKREIEEGAQLVICGGGDGTLSTCAEYLANSNVAMGVLPLGTGNTFARSLGIPVDLKGATQTIAHGKIEPIDVGQCNSQIFLNSVSLGFSAELAESLTSQVKKQLGLLAWPYVGLRIGLKHRSIRLRITSPDHKEVLKTHQLMIANGRYVAGPIKASEDATVQDGELTVFALGGASKTELAKAVYEWLTHRHIESRTVPFFETKELVVESLGRRIKANVDGEVNERTPLNIKVLPKALKVVVPRDFVADKV
jgi:diacylglycerol kinase (ATP)